MSISSVARRAVLGITALGLVGCDSGELQEGMPKNIDMSKNYSPRSPSRRSPPRTCTRPRLGRRGPRHLRCRRRPRQRISSTSPRGGQPRAERSADSLTAPGPAPDGGTYCASAAGVKIGEAAVA